MLAQFVAAAVSIPTLMQPSGNWTVGYNQDSCTLHRSYGLDKEAVLLAFKPDVTFNFVELILVLPPNYNKRLKQGTAIVKISPASTEIKKQWVFEPFQDDRRLIKITADKSFWMNLSSSSTIDIMLDQDQRYLMSLSAIASAMKAIGTCEDDLVRGWGVDPKALVTDLPPALLVHWISADDYPAGSILQGDQGRVQTVTSFDRAGRLIACKVVVSSGVPLLDKATCDGIRHRASIPIVDAAGPAARYIYAKFDWRVP